MTDALAEILNSIKSSRYWPAVQPFFLLTSAFVAIEVLAYGYIDSWYGYRPSVLVFCRSHLFVQILIVYLFVLGVVITFKLTAPKTKETLGRVQAYLHANQRSVAIRTLAILLALSGIILGVIFLKPARASRVRIVFLDSPIDFQKEAFLYLIYELNRIQTSWYFEPAWDEFNPTFLKTFDANECNSRSDHALCYAETIHYGAAPSDSCLRSPDFEACYDKKVVDRDPLIAITCEEIGGGTYFASHRGKAAVISTADKSGYEPLSTYEYLMYTLLVQSISLHLSAHGGEPEGAFAVGTTSRGGLFEFAPGLKSLKARILAARLTPAEEQLLFNRFGPEYAGTCTKLLTLDWLRAQHVTSNLSRVFGINLKGSETPAE